MQIKNIKMTNGIKMDENTLRKFQLRNLSQSKTDENRI